MKPAILLSVLLLVTSSFVGQQPRPVKQTAAFTSVTPGFKVNLTLSDKAKQKLVKAHETVVVAGFLTGTPKPDAIKKYVDEMGMINLGSIKVEVTPGQVASFSEVKLPNDRLAQTDGADPGLLINVFSGRRSSKSNLLDCGIYEGGLHAAQGRTLEISCKLIDE